MIVIESESMFLRLAIFRQMQAVEGRMDELLRRQSSLERVLTAELAELHKTLRSSTGAETASVRISWGHGMKECCSALLPVSLLSSRSACRV